MKHLLLTIICVVLFIGCTTDEDSAILNEKLTINLALEKIKLESINSEKPIEFDISIDENNDILLGNAQIIPADRFKEDFSNRFKNNDISFKELIERDKNKTASVCCTVNGQNIGCIICQNGDGTCVGDAVQACLNDGGCSNVCPKKIRFIPSLKTFYVSKDFN